MDELLSATIGIVASHVTHNSVAAADLPALIQAVHGSLVVIATGATAPVEQVKPVPAVPIKKSVHHDYIVSLETGERLQTLRRHLNALGMTPDEYRTKWGLTADYPMTSAAYSAKRSQMSKDLGLGRKKSVEPVEAPPAAKKARTKATATAGAPLPQTGADSVQEPIKTIQDAA